MHYIDKKVVTLIFRIEKVTPPPLHFEVTRLNVKGSSSLNGHNTNTCIPKK